MGQGYVRVDTGNNIADGNVINASDLDGEFDGLVAAFAASTGHTHDGTTGEGGPISITGPSGQYRHNANDYSPSTTNTRDLGTTSLRWKDLYLSGDADIDGAVDIATTLDVAGAVDFASTLTVDGTVTLNGTLAQSASGVGPTYTRTSYGTFEINQGDIGLEYTHNGVGTLFRLVDSGAVSAVEVEADGSTTFRKEVLINYSTPQFRINNPDASASTRMWAQTISASTSALLFQNRTSGGTFNTQYSLQEDGSLNNSADIGVRAAMDARYEPLSSASKYKENITRASSSNMIKHVDLKRWTWGGELSEDDPRRGREGLGLIAEDVANVIPEAIMYNKDGEIEGLSGLVLIGVLWDEVQELRTKIEALENKGN